MRWKISGTNSLAVEDERQLATNVIRAVEAEQTGREIEHGAVGAFDGAHAGITVMRLGALVPQTQRVTCVFLRHAKLIIILHSSLLNHADNDQIYWFLSNRLVDSFYQFLITVGSRQSSDRFVN